MFGGNHFNVCRLDHYFSINLQLWISLHQFRSIPSFVFWTHNDTAVSVFGKKMVYTHVCE